MGEKIELGQPKEFVRFIKFGNKTTCFCSFTEQYHSITEILKKKKDT